MKNAAIAWLPLRLRATVPVVMISKEPVAEKLTCFIYWICRRTLKSKITKFASFRVLPCKVLALPFLQRVKEGVFETSKRKANL